MMTETVNMIVHNLKPVKASGDSVTENRNNSEKDSFKDMLDKAEGTADSSQDSVQGKAEGNQTDEKKGNISKEEPERLAVALEGMAVIQPDPVPVFTNQDEITVDGIQPILTAPKEALQNETEEADPLMETVWETVSEIPVAQEVQAAFQPQTVTDFKEINMENLPESLKMAVQSGKTASETINAKSFQEETVTSQALSAENEANSAQSKESRIFATETRAAGQETANGKASEEATTETQTIGTKTEETKTEETAFQEAADGLVTQLGDEEVIIVKVGDNHEINQEGVKNLAEKISAKIVEGKQEFEIQLNPEHLGRITVKLSMVAEGIKVILSCEDPKTMSLMAERVDGISRIVEGNTGTPTVVEVEEGNYWEQQKNATDQHQGQGYSQQQQKKESQKDGEVFLQRLRLGFIEN